MPSYHRILEAASALALEIERTTISFPPDEKLVLAPAIRDEMLSILENIALGMAPFHPIDRIRFLARATQHLDYLHGQLVLCKTTKILDWKTQDKLTEIERILREQLINAMKDARNAALGRP
jgi:four helix bundle protein